jgi:hypothetical protein
LIEKIKSYIKTKHHQPSLVIINLNSLVKFIKYFINSISTIGGLDKFESKILEITPQEVIENDLIKKPKLPKPIINNLNKSYVVLIPN